MAGSDKTIKVHIMIDGQEKVVTSYDEIKEHAKSANNEMLSITEKLKGLNEELAAAAEARDKALMEQISAQIRQLTDQWNMQKTIRDGLNREARELQKAQMDLNNIYQRMQGEGDGPYTVSQKKKDLRTVQNKYSYIDPADTENVEKMRAMMGELNYELQEQAKHMKAAIMPAEKLQKVLADMADPAIGASMNDLKSAQAELARQLKGLKPSDDGYGEVMKQYNAVTENIKRMNDEVKRSAVEQSRATADALVEEIKLRKEAANVAEGAAGGAEEGTKRLEDLLARTKQLKEEMNVAREFSERPDATQADIEAFKQAEEAYDAAAIDLRVAVKDGVKAEDEGLRAAAEAYKEAEEKLFAFEGSHRNERGYMTVKNDEIAHYRELQKNWEESKIALEEYEVKVAETGSATDGAVDKSVLSLNNLKNALKQLKEDGANMEIGGADWKKNQDKIAILEDAIKNLGKEAFDLEGVLNNLGSASLNDLKQAQKELNEQFAAADRSDTEAFNAVAENLKRVNAEINNVKDSLKETKKETVDVSQVLANIDTASLDDLKAARKQLNEEFGAMERGEGTDYEAKINDLKRVNEEIKAIEDSVKKEKESYMSLEEVMQGLAAASEKRAKAAWASSSEISNELKNELKVLRELIEAAEASKGPAGIPDLDKLSEKNNGFFYFLKDFKETGTELDELVEKYKQANEEIRNLSPLTGTDEEKARFRVLYEQIDTLEKQIAGFDGKVEIEVGTEGVDKAIVSTKNLKHAEEELKKTLLNENLTEEKRVATSKILSTVQQELARREKIVSDETKRAAQAAKDAEIGYNGWKNVTANLGKATIPQMKRAMEDMKKELDGMEKGSTEFKKMSVEIAKVKDALGDANTSLKEHASKWEEAISRIKTYVTVYMGFSKLLDLGKMVVQNSFGLSDSIADVQKVTKMSAESVDALSRSIDKLDTRSSQETLHQLAYQAGLLGLHAQNDILGFVKAANQMNWALKEMGEDGAVELMKVATNTGEIEKLGGNVELALTKIGSAINEITANSAASAGPVTEIVGRLGAVGSSAGYASHELVAIGSTLNALGLKTEASATAVSKIMTALSTNISKIAYDLGVSADDIAANGDSFQQLVFVLETLNNKATESGKTLNEVIKPLLKDFGRDGQRLQTTLVALAEHFDILASHASITSQAYEEGTSMLKEYNVKNETLAAQLERIGNNLKEHVINSRVTRGLTSVAAGVERITAGMSKWNALINPLVTVVKWLGIAYGSIKGLMLLVTLPKAINTSLRMLILSTLDHNKALEINTLLTNAKTAADRQAALAIRAEETSVRALTGAMMANPFTAWTMALTALVSVGYIAYQCYQDLTNATSELKLTSDDYREATNAVTNEISAEEQELSVLYGKLKDTKGEKVKLQAVIMELQSKYPAYLNNLNLEAASYTDVANAIAEVNKQLKLQAIIKMRAELNEKATEKFNKAQEIALEGIETDLKELFHGVNMFGIQWTNGAGGGKDSYAIRQAIGKAIREGAEADYSKLGFNNSQIESSIKNSIEKAIRSVDASIDLSSFNSKTQIGDLAQEAMNLRRTLAGYKQAQADIDDFAKNRAAFFDIDLKEYDVEVKKYESSARGVPSVAGGNGGGFIDFDSSKRIGNIAGTDVTTLGEWYDNLEALGKMKKDSPEFARRYQEAFGVLPSDTASATSMISRYSEMIKKEMAKQGFTTNVTHKSPAKGRTSHPKGPKRTTVGGESMLDSEIKNQYDAALAALKGYYQEQRAILEDKYIDGLVTDQELANRLEDLKRFEKFDTAELYKKLLGENNTFRQSQYGKWFDGKDLTKLSKFLLAMGGKDENGGEGGSALIDGMKKNAATAAAEARALIIQHMQEINKVLLQYNYEGTVDKDYQERLEKLDLFWGEYQDREEKGIIETSERQLAAFKALAQQSLTMTTDQLKMAMTDDDVLSQWFKGREDTLETDLQALLIMLQDYRHQLIDAQKKVGDEGHKRALEMAETAIETQTHIEKTQQANEALLKSLQSEGYVNSATVDRYEIDHLKQRIDYQKVLIKLIQLENGDTKKEYEVLTSLEEKLIEKNEEIQRSIRENMKAYVDVFNEMTSSLVTAGNEHAALSSLAEIAAKRRLGIAVDTTKKEYMIYSRNGKAVRKMMTDEEKLQWDMTNDMRNQQLDALVKWMHDWGEKIAQDLDNAVSSRLAIEQQRLQEKEQLKSNERTTDSAIAEENRKFDSIAMIEAQLTDKMQSENMTRVNNFSASVQQMVAAAAQGGESIAAGLSKGIAGLYKLGPLTDPAAWNTAFGSLKTAIANMTEEDLNAFRPMLSDFESPLYNTFQHGDIDTANRGKNDTFLKSDNYNHFFSVVNDLINQRLAELGVTDRIDMNYQPSSLSDFQRANEEGTLWGITAKENSIDEVGVVAKHSEAKRQMLQTEVETNRLMTESQKRMVMSMISAMNMYGVAYNAVMNDSLSVSQRVGIATLQSFGQVAMSMMSVLMSDTIASIGADEAKGIAKIWGKTPNPAIALPLIAIMTGALGAAMGLATKKITKSKSEIAAVTGAASGKKVAAGMLTYAEGNYPVLGSDGEVYDAKRETNWKTKVYSSPHYGILGEKGPELIVDGVTTRKMMTLRPDLYQDILDLARGRQAVRAKAYAEGNYPAMPAANASGTVAGDTNAMLVAAISQLNAQLAGGIKVAALGEDGAVRRLNEAEDWMRKHGLA